MIKDQMTVIEKYKASIPSWEDVRKILTESDLHSRPAGKYEPEGSGCFFMIADYETKPFSEERFEIHKKYIDLQVVLAGEEVIYNAPTPLLSPDKEGYIEENDIQFGTVTGSDTLLMRKDDFALLYPWDAHQPARETEKGPAKVRKLVIKIPVE